MQYILQIIIALGLITVIVLQAKGTGLGSAWGGSGMYHSKRGIEKSLFAITIILAIAFVATSAINSL
ncbi:MAG: preprotein translocase subunit SecG [bacterium]